MKRIFDILCSLVILSIFMPFGIIITLLIIFTSGFPVFYTQERVGQNGTIFRLYKFRTMKKHADKVGNLTVGMRDPRITSIGYYLRKLKLDEFPQFINVLAGSMSIVGPRPEVQKYVDMYTEEQRKILKVKPGITDLASLEYYSENELLGASDDPEKLYVDKIMPDKIELNKKYIENPGVGTDLKIMWRTFLRLFSE